MNIKYIKLTLAIMTDINFVLTLRSKLYDYYTASTTHEYLYGF